MRKVLFILQSLTTGGVASVIMNYYRNVQGIHADFVVLQSYGIVPENISREISQRGGEIYYVTPFTKNMIKYYCEVSDIIAKGEYEVVHDNNKYFGFLSLISAKKYKVPIRISHVHNDIAKREQSLLKRIYITIFAKATIRYANKLCACSREAGESMFGQREYEIIYTAIDIERYSYDESKRQQLRYDLGIDDRFVLLMVARQDPLKRFDFAFEVYENLFKLKEKTVFVLVGLVKEELGDRDKKVYDRLEESVRETIHFCGIRQDVHQLINVADAFILTSEHEGFGIVIIEALANGLNCFVSDALPAGVAVSESVHFLPTLREPDLWAEVIAENSKNENRHLGKDAISGSVYNIKNVVLQIKNMYCMNDDKLISAGEKEND